LSSLGYAQNLFLSYNQARDMNAHVRKGEKGHEVVFWKWVEHTDPLTGEVGKLPFLRYYTVFNIEQCDGIKRNRVPLPEKPIDPIKSCKDIITKMPQRPEVRFIDEQAYYNPVL